MEFGSTAKILVLGYTPYQIKDERTGAVTSGTTVRYLFWGDHGESLQSVFTDPSVAGGVAPAKVSLPYESRNDILKAPAVYNGDFIMSVGSDGKPVLKLQAVKYLCDVEFKEVLSKDSPSK